MVSWSHSQSCGGDGGDGSGEGGAVEIENASMYTVAPRRVPKWKASGWIGTPGVLWKVYVARVHGTVPPMLIDVTSAVEPGHPPQHGLPEPSLGQNCAITSKVQFAVAQFAVYQNEHVTVCARRPTCRRYWAP